MEEWGKLLSTNHSNRHYELFRGELFPEKLFGQTDAITEWEEDKDLSSKLFVHTESYEVFKRKSNLFVFGRRGTGKTALIKMLDYEIKNKLFNLYNYSKIVSQEDTFYRLTLELRTFKDIHTKSELTHIIKEKLIWVIYTTAMIAVVEQNQKNNSSNQHINKIRQYLADENFIRTENRYVTTTPISKAVNIFSDNFEKIDYDKNKSSIALNNTLRELDSERFRSALNSLVAFLTESKESCVILIDSQEIYEFNDNLSEYVISGLMDAVLKIYNQHSTYKIFVKVAFPSEIVPHLEPANRSKTNDKGHYIFWKYADLLTLISKRYCQLLNERELINAECEEIRNKGHKEFIYEFIPANTESYSGIDFDSIAYIINHTQKKPREVIMLFNLILTLAKRNQIPFNKLTPACVKEGTNARIEDLSSGVLDMYRKIYPKAEQVIKKTFNNSKNILTFGEMHRKLQDSLSLLATSGMDRNNAERLFTETGVIGVLENLSQLGDKSKYICEANYEYQIKGVLTLQSQDKLVIHPMFYQELNIRVHSNILVCPKPSETEREMALIVDQA